MYPPLANLAIYEVALSFFLQSAGRIHLVLTQEFVSAVCFFTLAGKEGLVLVIKRKRADVQSAWARKNIEISVCSTHVFFKYLKNACWIGYMQEGGEMEGPQAYTKT